MGFIGRKDPLPGRILLNTFHVVGRIGAGAVSDVYLARQSSVGNRNVAVKILKKLICQSDSPESSVHRKRFQFEAELLAMLKSGAYAALVDMGTLLDEVERPFMVMEYLAGVSMAEHVKTGRRFTLGGAARIVLLLGEALEELHRLKIVYRDLSPNNVILEEGGPYGLAPRLFDLSHAIVPGIPAMDAGGLAGTLLAGTPPYAAPELREGKGDQRSDVYSLAALFYAMVAGIAPLALRHGTWDEYAATVLRSKRLPEKRLRALVPGVPRGLDSILSAAMEPRPERRYGSAVQFMEDLCEVLLRSPQARPGGADGLLTSLLSRVLFRP